MTDFLAQPDLFPGLDSKGVERLSGIARKRTLESGEYLFLLGDNPSELAQFFTFIFRIVDTFHFVELFPRFFILL